MVGPMAGFFLIDDRRIRTVQYKREAEALAILQGYDNIYWTSFLKRPQDTRRPVPLAYVRRARFSFSMTR
jgi:hypothetical protein